MQLDNLHLRVFLRDGQAGDALELGNKTVGGNSVIDVNKVLGLFNDTFKLHVLCLCVDGGCCGPLHSIAFHSHSIRRVGYTAHSNLTASSDRSADPRSKVSLGQLTLLQQLQKFPPALGYLGVVYRRHHSHLYLDCVRRLIRRFGKRFCFRHQVN